MAEEDERGHSVTLGTESPKSYTSNAVLVMNSPKRVSPEPPIHTDSQSPNKNVATKDNMIDGPQDPHRNDTLSYSDFKSPNGKSESLESGRFTGSTEDVETYNGSECSSSKTHLKSSSLPHGVKLCPENEGGEAERRNKAMEEEQRWACLEEELKKAQLELREKDAEVEILKGIRQQVEGELEDLTASLFQEAHKMVTAAKMKEVSSEKSLTEARMQLEGLQAEVTALKALLITSTPSRPNLGNSNGLSIFKKQHKRTPSHNHLQYGRPDGDSVQSEQPKEANEIVIDRSRCDVDPILFSQFAEWRVNPTFSTEKSPFLQRMYAEDIDPCLLFANSGLVKRLKKAVEDNSVWVEPLQEKDRSNIQRECALLKSSRICHYRMRFAFDSEEWYDISLMCRDRIAAVCEFLNYLRYTKNGLVTVSVEDAYWELLRLRKQMTIAKLGISIS